MSQPSPTGVDALPSIGGIVVGLQWVLNITLTDDNDDMPTEVYRLVELPVIAREVIGDPTDPQAIRIATQKAIQRLLPELPKSDREVVDILLDVNVPIGERRTRVANDTAGRSAEIVDQTLTNLAFYLRHQPKQSPLGQASRWIQRHKTLIFSGVLAACTVLGGVAAAVQLLGDQTSTTETEQSTDDDSSETDDNDDATVETGDDEETAAQTNEADDAGGDDEIDVRAAEVEVATLREPQPGVALAMATVGDGWLGVVGNQGFGVQLWDVNGERPRTTYDGHGTQDVYAITPLADGSVATGGGLGFQAWQVGADGFVFEKQQTQTVLSLAGLPDGRVLAGDDTAMVKAWNLVDSSLPEIEGRPHFDTRATNASAVIVLANGDVVSAASDGVRRWTPTPPSPGNKQVITESTLLTPEPVLALGAVPNGPVLAAGPDDDETSVLVFDPITDASTQYDGHDAAVQAVAVFNQDAVATGDADGNIHLWNPSSLRTTSDPLITYETSIEAMVALPDGRLAVATSDGKVDILTFPEQEGRVANEAADGEVPEGDIYLRLRANSRIQERLQPNEILVLDLEVADDEWTTIDVDCLENINDYPQLDGPLTITAHTADPYWTPPNPVDNCDLDLIQGPTEAGTNYYYTIQLSPDAPEAINVSVLARLVNPPVAPTWDDRTVLPQPERRDTDSISNTVAPGTIHAYTFYVTTRDRLKFEFSCNDETPPADTRMRVRGVDADGDEYFSHDTVGCAPWRAPAPPADGRYEIQIMTVEPDESVLYHLGAMFQN